MTPLHDDNCQCGQCHDDIELDTQLQGRLFVLAMEPKTFNGAQYVCLTEEGEVLAQHYCSSDDWAQADLGVIEHGFGVDRRKVYEERFPLGFTVEFLEYDDPRATKFRGNKEKEMSDNNSKFESFKEVAEPLIKWLNENCNPHTTIVVTPDSAELLSGEMAHKTTEFILD